MPLGSPIPEQYYNTRKEGVGLLPAAERASRKAN
jgi:hypothetical protein